MKTKKVIIGIIVLLFSLLSCYILYKFFTNDPLYPQLSPPLITVDDINNKFKSHNGVIVMISGYRGADTPTEQYRRNKIYLENCAIF